MAHPADLPLLKPVNISSYVNANFEKFAMSPVHVCGIISGATRQVLCWGWTAAGQQGRLNPDNNALPAQVASTFVLNGANSTYSGIAVGASTLMDGKGHTIIFDEDRFLASGLNSFGQLGDGTVAAQTSSPVVVAPPL